MSFSTERTKHALNLKNVFKEKTSINLLVAKSLKRRN